MKKKQHLPIPFVILIMAAMVSVYSLIASRVSGATVTQNEALQTQTVEQERVAEIYFRVLSWLSNTSRQPIVPVKPSLRPTSIANTVSAQWRSGSPTHLATCAYRYARNFTLHRTQARSIN